MIIISDVEINLDRLPDDPALLRQMLRDAVTTAAYQHGELHAENDKLRMLIKRLLRHRFGRRSEQLGADQLQFGLEDLEQTVAANQAGPGGCRCRCGQTAQTERCPAQSQSWRVAGSPAAL